MAAGGAAAALAAGICWEEGWKGSPSGGSAGTHGAAAAAGVEGGGSSAMVAVKMGNLTCAKHGDFLFSAKIKKTQRAPKLASTTKPTLIFRAKFDQFLSSKHPPNPIFI